MDEYTGAENPYDTEEKPSRAHYRYETNYNDGTNAPPVNAWVRAWTGETGGNPVRTPVTYEDEPGRFTVTKEQYDRGERP